MRTSSVRKLLAHLGKNWPLYALALLFTMMDKVVDSLGISMAVKTVADGAVSGDAAAVMTGTKYLILVALGRSTFLALSYFAVSTAAERMAHGARTRLIGASLGASEAHAADQATGSAVSVVVNDVETAKQGLSSLQDCVGQVFIVGIVFVTLFALSWQTAVCTAAMAMLCLWTGAAFASPVKRHSATYQSRLATVTEAATSLLSGIAVVKSLRAEKLALERFDRAAGESYSAGQARGTVMSVQSAVASAVPLFAMGAVMAVTGTMALRGLLTPGEAIALTQLATRAFFPFARLGSAWATLQTNLASVDRVDVALGAPQETAVRLPAPQAARRDYAQSIAPSLEFDDVTFRYEGRNVLSGTSLNLPGGKRLALVGPSGSGKSTVLKLLMGLRRPDSGTIRLDGRDLLEIPLDELRSVIAYVPQEPWVFPGTIRENIELGKLGASMEDVVCAADAAHIHEFISGLPGGYDTVIDEKGSNLSGGEKQRICLARALLKDAPVLLLDEPTSSVDAESERLIIQALDETAKGRTVVTVSHTGSLGSGADVVVELQPQS